LWQNASTVPEYAAQFKQLMARTGYSPADLRDRFYEHLTTKIKDELVHTARPIAAFDDLISVATDIDTQVRQRRAEKDREKPRTGATPGTGTTHVPAPAPGFVNAPVDPNVMDVDATRSREEFMRRMRGKCFRCGSSLHAKKDGKHDISICAKNFLTFRHFSVLFGLSASSQGHTSCKVQES
jgi:hypothetical protein